MKRKIVYLVLICVSLSTIQQSCSKTPETPEENDCEVSYKNDLVPITQTSCAGGYCHATGDHFSIYENIKAVVDNGQLWEKVIETREMPPYPSSISEEERDLFACWIESGAPNN